MKEHFQNSNQNFQKKKKGKEEIKIKTGPGETFQPSARSQPAAHSAS
jgi:hypothetical protein